MLIGSWFGSGSGGSSSGSGSGGWGAFSPNVGVSSSSGGWTGGGWGSSGLGGFGTSFGGGFGGGVARTFDQVGGGGGDRSGNRYDANGFGIGNEGSSGGTQQTTNTPITDFGTMEVVARRPDATHTSDQTSRNIQGLFDQSTLVPVTNLGERVVVTAPRKRDNDPPPFIPNDYYNPRERLYDPSIPTLDTVVAVKPDPNEITDRQFNDWRRNETVKVFKPFTGLIGATYDFVRDLFSGNWWGVVLATAGAIPIGKFGGFGYSSFRAFKRVEGAAGQGMHWHHIVEQNPINKRQFSPYQLHNVDNLRRVDVLTHNKITAEYNRLDPTTGLRFRETVWEMPFDDQYQVGVDMMKRFGVEP